MKKILIGLSCLMAMSISLQANADTAQSKVTKKVIKKFKGSAAVNAGRTAIGEGMQGAKAATATNAARTSMTAVGQQSSADALMSQAAEVMSLADGKVPEDHCALGKVGNSDITSAILTGLVTTGNCSAELSQEAWQKFAPAIEKAADELERKFVTKATATDIQLEAANVEYIKGLEAQIDGIPNGGPVNYNVASARAKQICNSCQLGCITQ